MKKRKGCSLNILLIVAFVLRNVHPIAKYSKRSRGLKYQQLLFYSCPPQLSVVSTWSAKLNRRAREALQRTVAPPHHVRFTGDAFVGVPHLRCGAADC